jgi:hypothetical protein
MYNIECRHVHLNAHLWVFVFQKWRLLTLVLYICMMPYYTVMSPGTPEPQQAPPQLFLMKRKVLSAKDDNHFGDSYSRSKWRFRIKLPRTTIRPLLSSRTCLLESLKGSMGTRYIYISNKYATSILYNRYSIHRRNSLKEITPHTPAPPPCRNCIKTHEKMTERHQIPKPNWNFNRTLISGRRD